MKKTLQAAWLLAVSLLTWCAPAHAVVGAGTSYVNSNSVAQTSGTVTMTTVDANSVVLVTVATDDDGTDNVISVPTATGLTFVIVAAKIRSANNFNLAIYRAWTTSSLGSTVITCTWTRANDWVMGATDYTGTAGTAGNNASDAIGGTNTATSSGSGPATVTVTSTSHDNSKYYGGIVFGNIATRTITAGGSYTLNVPSTYDGTFVGLATELSNNPVTPAANTIVDATLSSTVTQWGDYGIEILVAGAGGATSSTLTLLGTGK